MTEQKQNSMFCLSTTFFFCLVADAWRENLFTSMKGLYTGLLNPKAKRRHRFQLASYSMCDELNTFVDLYVAF